MNDSALSITTKTFPSAFGRGEPANARGQLLRPPGGEESGAQLARVAGEGAEAEAVTREAYGLDKTQSVTPGDRVEGVANEQGAQQSGSDKSGDPSETTDLERAVESINDYLQSSKRSLEFSVDNVSGRTIIKVMDAENEKVIRQIPPETALEIMRKLHDGDGVAATGLAEKA